MTPEDRRFANCFVFVSAVDGEHATPLVDVARLQIVGSLYRELGFSAPDADARAVLFYAFLFGQGMLFLDETPRKRASLAAACANILTETEHK